MPNVSCDDGVDLDIPSPIPGHSSSAIKLYDNDRKWQGNTCLFGPHSHFVYSQQPKIDSPHVHDTTMEGCVLKAHNRLILGRHDGDADEVQQESSGNVQAPLLDTWSNHNPYISVFMNHRTKPPIEII